MLRIALVYPEFRIPTFWSFREALALVNKSANMPPYGLITVAGMLPKSFDVKLYDENIAPVSDTDLQAADLVMASAMIVQKDSLNDLIARCRSIGRPIIVGGPLINTGFQDVSNADYYYIGEAEQGLPRFLSDFMGGKAKRAYGHVADKVKAGRIFDHFRGSISVIVGERPSLTDSPLPRFDLLDHARYGSMAVQFSRGCPVACEFCDIWTQYGRKPRIKAVDRMLAELSAIRRIGYEGAVFIVDDNFIGNKKAVKDDLLPALIEWQRRENYPFNFFTEATVTMADDDVLLNLMHEAGFDMVFCGIETPDEQSLLAANKALNTDYKTHQTGAKLLKQIEKIQRSGIEVSTGLIVGLDSEPSDIDRLMADFIQEARIPLAMAGLLTALPETELERRLLQEGRLKAASSGNNTHTFSMNFHPLRAEADVIRTYKNLLHMLYDASMARYFERCDGLMDRMAARPRVGKLRDRDWKVLFRSLLRMARTRYGWSYIKFLTRRLIKDPRTFAEAVAYGVKGHHLAQMTKRSIEVQEIESDCDQLLRRLDESLQRISDMCRQDKALSMVQIRAYKDSLLSELQARIRKVKRTANRTALVRYEGVLDQVLQRFSSLESVCMGALGHPSD